MKKLLLLLAVLLVSCSNSNEQTKNNELSDYTEETEINESFNESIFVSQTLEAFYDELFIKLLDSDPEYIDSIGDLSAYGVVFQKDRLSIRDETFYQDRKHLLEDALAVLHTFEIPQSNEDYINYRNVEWYLEIKLEEIEFIKQSFFLSHIIGEHRELYDLLLEIHIIENKKDAEDWIKRVIQSEEKISDWIKRYNELAVQGYYMDDVNVDYTISQVSSMYKSNVEFMALYKNFVSRVEQLGLSENEKNTLIEEAYTSIETYYVPAMKELKDMLYKAKEFSDMPQGVYHMPDGERYYEHALKKHTTTTMTPEEIYQLGLNEVKRIQEDMINSLNLLGYDGDLSSMLNALTNSSQVFYGQNAMDAYVNAASDIEAGLSDFFYEEDLPASSPDIRKSPGGNFYVSPSIDGKRSGVYYLDLNGPHSEIAINTLAYHETVPGHHLEREHELLLNNIPMIRKLAFNTAYIEGWALYAEMLADENGYNDTPEKHIGYLKSELHRAARLVVDTGLHYKGWDRETAVAYLVDEGLLNSGYANAEVTRYMSWPGQACSYKIGQLKLLELRNKMENAMGDQFDIKEFHHLVLANGSMPLIILEEYVEQYLDEMK